MIVIFDTNGYRKFVEDKELSQIKDEIESLRKLEQSKNITPYMCTTVAMELLKHLMDKESSRSFKSCLKSVQAMYCHCANAESYRLLPLPEVQIAKEYFDVENHISIETQKSVGYILYQISQSPSSETVNKYKDAIIKIIDFIHVAEESLAKEIEGFIKSVDSSATSWDLYSNDPQKRKEYLAHIRSERFERDTAVAMLYAVKYDLEKKGYVIKINDIENKIEAYRASYKASLVFRKTWWEYIANGNFDIRKKSRANYLWDEYVLHFVNKTVGEEQILLVTTDMEMINAAKKIDQNTLIFTYEYYIEFLNS